MVSVIDDSNLLRKIFTFCNKICLLKLNSINKYWSAQIPNIKLFKASDYSSLKDIALFVALPFNKVNKLTRSLVVLSNHLGWLDDTTKEYLYSIRTILAIILKRYGGWEGIEIRRQQKENQEKSKKLACILQFLKLQPRQDSVIQHEYVHRNKHCLSKVIFTACYMHWLHNYTEYAQELNELVNKYAEKVGYYYPGIYYEIGEILQNEPKYQPPTTWTWLSQFKSREAAIKAAVAKAN